MSRPRIPRHLRFDPNVEYFKPRGVPLTKLEEVVLHHDEIEALKLHEIDKLEQTQAAERMRISQPTFARILHKARKKVAEAIVFGRAIKIKKRA